jgi:hypothetical protein
MEKTIIYRHKIQNNVKYTCEVLIEGVSYVYSYR